MSGVNSKYEKNRRRRLDLIIFLGRNAGSSSLVNKVNDGHDLAEIMKKFKGCSALELNRALGMRGTFWQHGYYDHALRNEEDIKQIARYIVANPLRAGLVDKIEMYPYWDAKWV